MHTLFAASTHHASMHCTYDHRQGVHPKVYHLTPNSEADRRPHLHRAISSNHLHRPKSTTRCVNELTCGRQRNRSVSQTNCKGCTAAMLGTRQLRTRPNAKNRETDARWVVGCGAFAKRSSSCYPLEVVPQSGPNGSGIRTTGHASWCRRCLKTWVWAWTKLT